MATGSCCLSMIPVRSEPTGRATMVNQLLFGDRVKVLEEIPDWVKISSIHDGYEGWCETNQLTFDQVEEPEAERKLVSDITSSFISGNKLLTLVYGSHVHLINGELKIGNDRYIQISGNLTPPLELNGKNIVANALKLIGSPYLWGGRSPFGIDCSGLIQVIFKFSNLALPRDAWQQAEHPGEFIDLIAETAAGDVAFFDNEEGKIIHTGILTGDGSIIHASGKVRIDSIDHNGIYNRETGKYSHKLRIIKRFRNN